MLTLLRRMNPFCMSRTKRITIRILQFLSNFKTRFQAKKRGGNFSQSRKGIRQTKFHNKFRTCAQMQMRFPGLITRVINDFRQTTRSAARRTMVSPINCLTESGLRKGCVSTTLLHLYGGA